MPAYCTIENPVSGHFRDFWKPRQGPLDNKM